MSYWTADPRTLGLPIFSKPLHPLSLAAPSQTLDPIAATHWAEKWPKFGKNFDGHHQMSAAPIIVWVRWGYFWFGKKLCRSKNRFEPKCLKSYWKPPSSCFGLDTASINQSGPGLQSGKERVEAKTNESVSWWPDTFRANQKSTSQLLLLLQV